ncbi:hypothetical protein BVX94_01385 [bacterium B17]|nr:hypothetical protein BVX94_01385 [bacterium B17]
MDRSESKIQIKAWMLTAFFLSGFCGLAYEVLALRIFRVIIGNASSAVTAVLCAYMSGLAIGSLSGGWVSERRGDLLRVYSFLLFGTALYFAAFPFLAGLALPICRAAYPDASGSMYLFNVLRFFICWLTLLVPCVFMGATLPLLVRYFASDPDERGRCSAGVLYAVNTIGGAAGAFAAGFILMPQFGVNTSIIIVCILNVLSGVIAHLSHRASGDVPIKKSEGTGAFKKNKGLVLIAGYTAAGFAALVYEVAWTRILCIIIGSSVYAFSMILTVFILGIGLGSIVFTKPAAKLKQPLAALSIVEIATGLSALLVVPLIAALPEMVKKAIINAGQSFAVLQAAEFGLIMLVMLVPTLLLGAAFPLAARHMAELDSTDGRSVGRLCGMNMLGCIFGSVAAGYLFIPAVGVQHTIYIAVLLNIAIGIAFVFASDGISMRKRIIWALVSVTIVLAVMKGTPGWSRNKMGFGAFVQARSSASGKGIDAALKNQKELFYKDGVSASVSVRETATGERVMVINGKPDASSVADLRTQMLSAHIPILLHEDPQEVLLVGLATGISAGSVCTHEIKKLDCVEISSAVIEASRYFDEHNYKVVENPLMQIIMGDGRNHLELTEKKYDVIISNPSNPWVSGMSDLFTREFFKLCRDRLKPNGILCVWLESYTVNRECFLSVAAAFHEIFPEMNLWSSKVSDYLLIGFEREAKPLDINALQKRLARNAVSKDLKRIDVLSAPDLFGNLITDSKSVEKITRGALVHTDDNGLLEFTGPGNVVRNADSPIISMMVNGERTRDISFVVERVPGHPLIIDSVRNIQARGHAEQGYMSINMGKIEEGISDLKSATAGNRRDPVLQRAITALMSRAAVLVNIGRPADAEAIYKRILEMKPVDPKVHYGLGFAYASLKEPEKALKHYNSAVRFDYRNPYYHVALAALAWEQGMSVVAAKHYKMAIILKPDWPEIVYNLSVVLASAKEKAVRNELGAIKLAERAKALAERQGKVKLVEIIKAHIKSLKSN